MAKKYKITKHPEDPKKNGLLLAEDGVNYTIGVNLGDKDGYLYKDYQAWLDAGNTPEAAD